MRGRRFNKRAKTPYFKNKVALAYFIIKNWKSDNFKKGPFGFYQRGVFKDEELNVYIDVSISLKCKGLGQGLPIDCSLSWSYEHHPEHNRKTLSVKEVKYYLNKYESQI